MKQKPRPLTAEEMKTLTRFVCFEITLSELLVDLRGILKFDFTPNKRSFESGFVVPEPGVRITSSDIDRAIARHASGQISREELTKWATMLLLNDAYDWEGPDEDEIAGRLNDLSMPQLFLKGIVEQ
jgi:hypothetical protein